MIPDSPRIPLCVWSSHGECEQTFRQRGEFFSFLRNRRMRFAANRSELKRSRAHARLRSGRCRFPDVIRFVTGARETVNGVTRACTPRLVLWAAPTRNSSSRARENKRGMSRRACTPLVSFLLNLDANRSVHRIRFDKCVTSRVATSRRQ